MTEQQHVEWKESWRDDGLGWIYGFANAQGSVLKVSRDSRREVVGVKNVLRGVALNRFLMQKQRRIWEGVVNAVAHRDYATPAPSQIRVDADRIVLWNPGRLPQGGRLTSRREVTLRVNTIPWSPTRSCGLGRLKPGAWASSSSLEGLRGGGWSCSPVAERAAGRDTAGRSVSRVVHGCRLGCLSWGTALPKKVSRLPENHRSLPEEPRRLPKKPNAPTTTRKRILAAQVRAANHSSPDGRTDRHHTQWRQVPFGQIAEGRDYSACWSDQRPGAGKC